MPLTLGTTKRGKALTLTGEERSRHVHVLGASGTGKSKLLEALIRQDILGGRGLCLIDPHGTLANSVLEWCAAIGIDRHRRVHVLDLKDEAWSTGFNPLQVRHAGEVEARVDAMVSACAEVWGGEDLNQTPLLSTCLQLIFYALAASNLTLAEALTLTASAEPAARRRLTADMGNPVYAAYWHEADTLSTRDFEERFSSARRRLLRFLTAPSIRRIVGQREHALDLPAIMDGGEILIVNLAPRGGASHENARLLGALLMNELRLCAFGRSPGRAQSRPFSLYVDECYDYLTGDVERMLDETRKFGLHLVLAHQRLGQLRARSPAIYNGVMAGAQTKLVFGGMVDEDAEIMAREVFRSTFNLERPKRSLNKPTVIDEVPYWLESESATEGEGRSESGGDSVSWGRTSGTSESIGQSFDAEGDIQYGLSNVAGTSASEMDGGGSTSGWARATSASTTAGRAQTLKPVRVTMPTAVHSLEEELHFAIVKLRELPNQAAIVKRRGHPPVRFRPTTVKPALAWPELTSTFLTSVHSSSPYVRPTAEADAEIADRAAKLGAGKVPEQAEPEEFWAE